MKKFKASSAVTGYMTIYGSLYDICMTRNFGTGNFELFHYSNFKICFLKNNANLLNGELFQKSLVTFFRGTYALSVGFNTQPLQISVFLC